MKDFLKIYLEEMTKNLKGHKMKMKLLNSLNRLSMMKKMTQLKMVQLQMVQLQMVQLQTIPLNIQNKYKYQAHPRWLTRQKKITKNFNTT